MNPANVREALLECRLDELEGADMLLIKPALPYLDVIAKVREATSFHLAPIMSAASMRWSWRRLRMAG